MQRSNNLEVASQLYWELVRNLPGKDNDEYRKNPRVTTSLLRTRQAKINLPVRPRLYKNLFNLKFETGPQVQKLTKKSAVHLGK